MNLRIGSVVITDIRTWRQDLWDAGWRVWRFNFCGIRLLRWEHATQGSEN